MVGGVAGDMESVRAARRSQIKDRLTIAVMIVSLLMSGVSVFGWLGKVLEMSNATTKAVEAIGKMNESLKATADAVKDLQAWRTEVEKRHAIEDDRAGRRR